MVNKHNDRFSLVLTVEEIIYYHHVFSYLGVSLSHKVPQYTRKTNLLAHPFEGGVVGLGHYEKMIYSR